MNSIKILSKILIVMLLFLIAGCGLFSKSVSTESGKELSKTFRAANTVLTSSKQFYILSLSIAGDAYKKGYLSSSQKEEILKYAKEFKELHNNAASELLNWYSEIESCDGNNCNSIKIKGERTIEYLFELVKKGETMSKLIERYSGGKVDIPNDSIPNLFEIVESLKGLIK